jgi:oxygen-independent coproporphyrinogen-3 oxidase
MEDRYIDALVKEINGIEQNNFETMFVGGGTPTILSAENMEKLLTCLSGFSPEEYTFESNPGTTSEEKLGIMRKYGVNRLSIGLQAWQDRLLEKLGRIHKLDDFLHSYSAARESGFTNINIDLMFGIPGQTMGDWIETLKNVVDLKPEHLSCYSLIIEEGTPFFDMNEKGMLILPTEDTERDMYKYTIENLTQSGYGRYEISNFSKPGFECRHNITYWKDEEYIGVGAGAHSYAQGTRYNNFAGIKDYIMGVEQGSPVYEKNPVTPDDEIAEYMFLGLRMMEGISKENFFNRFKTYPGSIYSKQIKSLVEKGLLYEDKERICLTQIGIDLSNQVFVEFIR